MIIIKSFDVDTAVETANTLDWKVLPIFIIIILCSSVAEYNNFMIDIPLYTNSIDFLYNNFIDIIPTYLDIKKTTYDTAQDSYLSACNSCKDNKLIHNIINIDMKNIFYIDKFSIMSLKSSIPMIIGGHLVNQIVMTVNGSSSDSENNRAESSRAAARRNTISRERMRFAEIWNRFTSYGQGYGFKSLFIMEIFSKLGPSKFISVGFEYEAIRNFIKGSMDYYNPWANSAKGQDWINQNNFFSQKTLEKRYVAKTDGLFGPRAAANALFTIIGILYILVFPRLRYTLDSINLDIASNLLNFDLYYRLIMDCFDADSLITLAGMLHDYVSIFDSNNLLQTLSLPTFLIRPEEANLISNLYPDLKERLYTIFLIPTTIHDINFDIYNTWPWITNTVIDVSHVHPDIDTIIKNGNLLQQQPFLDLVWTEEMLSRALGLPPSLTIEFLMTISIQNIIDFLESIKEQFPDGPDNDPSFDPYSDDPKGKGKAKK